MKDLWNDNKLQFPRLISETDMAGGFSKELMNDLCESMDLTILEIHALIDRATKEFDKIKKNL